MDRPQPSPASDSNVSTPASANDGNPYATPQPNPAVDAKVNPYAAPETATQVERKAYSLGQVVCGTFFGSLFCTAFMVRNNYKAFGKDASATKGFWALFGAAVLITLVSIAIPGRLISTVISLICLFIMSNWYTSHMLRDYKVYTRTKGREMSNWWVLGLILFCFGCIFAIAVLVALGCELAGVKLSG